MVDVILIAAVLALVVGTARADDPCSAQMPAKLSTAISSKYPEYRLPVISDVPELVIADAAREGFSACVLVTKGDLNCDGKVDYAALLPQRKGRRVMLVVAFAGSKGWRLTQLGGAHSSVESAFLQRLPPGDYQETLAVTDEGKERRRLRGQCDGLITGHHESFADALFFQKGKWVSVRLTD